MRTAGRPQPANCAAMRAEPRKGRNYPARNRLLHDQRRPHPLRRVPGQPSQTCGRPTSPFSQPNAQCHPNGRRSSTDFSVPPASPPRQSQISNPFPSANPRSQISNLKSPSPNLPASAATPASSGTSPAHSPAAADSPDSPPSQSAHSAPAPCAGTNATATPHQT